MPPDPAPLAPLAPVAGRMQAFAAALAAAAGALVEPIAPEGLEILAPPDMQAALEVGEFCRLGFGPSLPEGAVRVGIEGAWLDRFARLLGPRGTSLRLVLPGAGRMPGDPERVLGHELAPDNAVVRLVEIVPAWTRYLLFAFRFSAVSDDKREGMLRFAVNLATGALLDGTADELAGLAGDPPDDAAPADWPAAAELPASWDRARIAALLDRAVPPRLEAELAPFLRGLHRRLARDQDRLFAYHNELRRDALRRAEGLAAGDPARERAEQRAAAIEREYRARLDDLGRQYALRVGVDWVQTTELAVPVARFQVRLRRRKAERMLALDWNLATRRLDPPTCEDTLRPERVRLVCDEALHVLSAAGLDPCPGCAKPFCRACHAAACPKCAAPVPSAREAAAARAGAATP